jgi:hypothetical protein
MRSKRWLIGAATCAALLPGATHAGVTEATFQQLSTTADLVDLCTAGPSDPMGTAALNFCQGFAVGVYRVLEEENAAKRYGRLFCIPNNFKATRNEAIADFVQWAKATPGVMSERPANGLTHYLETKYPCPRGK